MTADLQDAFADTAYWIALVVKQDQYHERAKAWSLRVKGRIITTVPVLLETANALARLATRAACVAILDNLQKRKNVEVAPLSQQLWQRAWELYCDRKDKTWSLTDCSSFLVMGDCGLTDALTPDEHFKQAGFRAVMLEQP
jgi:predicted nucleic acid-binding protein